MNDIYPQPEQLLHGAAAGLQVPADLAQRALDGGRRRLQRRRLVRAGTGGVVAVMAVAVTVSLRPGAGWASLREGPAASPSSTVRPSEPAKHAATPTPTPTPSNERLVALPASQPPAPLFRSLDPTRDSPAVQGSGWALSVSRGSNVNSPAGFSVTTPDGSSRGGDFAVTRIVQADGSITKTPLQGIVAAGVARLTVKGRRVVVVTGAVPRGTAGVGLLQADGTRSWLQLVDPGPAYDVLLFAGESASEPLLLQSTSTDRRVLSDFVLRPTLLPQPSRDPGQDAAAGVAELYLRAQQGGENDPSLCLRELATRKETCFSTFDSHRSLELKLRLADGRLAVGGTAPPTYTLARLIIEADGSVHPLRLGDDPTAPLRFLWVGDAPQGPPRQIVLPSAGPLQPGPRTITRPGADVRLVFGNEHGAETG